MTSSTANALAPVAASSTGTRELQQLPDRRVRVILRSLCVCRCRGQQDQKGGDPFLPGFGKLSVIDVVGSQVIRHELRLGRYGGILTWSFRRRFAMGYSMPSNS